MSALQEAYDKIYEHFTKPDARFGYDNETGCVYRGYGDTHSQIRCAFGVQIPDNEYCPSMENTNCRQLIMEHDLGIDSSDEKLLEFFDNSQSLHDRMASKCSPRWGTELLPEDDYARYEWTPADFVRELNKHAPDYGIEIRDDPL